MKKDNQNHIKESERIIDDHILQLLRDRDSVYLEKIFIEVNPYLSRICFANGLEALEVKEILQQTWAQFFLNIEKFEGRSQIRTFVCGILFNKIREFRRDQKRISPEEDISNILDNSFTLEGWWKQDPGDPFKKFELKQASEFIKICLEGLTEQQMTAFIMKEVEEHESSEICDFLNVNLSNLRVLIFRAKEKLKKCLEGKLSVESGF